MKEILLVAMPAVMRSGQTPGGRIMTLYRQMLIAAVSFSLALPAVAAANYNRSVDSVIVVRTPGAKTFMVNVHGRVGTQVQAPHNLSEVIRISLDGVPIDSLLLGIDIQGEDVCESTSEGCQGPCPPQAPECVPGISIHPQLQGCGCSNLIDDWFGPFTMTPGQLVVAELHPNAGGLAEIYTDDDSKATLVPPIFPGVSPPGGVLLTVALALAGAVAISLRSVRQRRQA